MPNPNEVGAAWKKTAQSGLKYLSVSLNLDKLMVATGGQIDGKVNLALFAKKGEKAKDSQPDYDLIYSAPSTGRGMRQERQQRQSAPVEPESEWPDDPEIPF